MISVVKNISGAGVLAGAPCDNIPIADYWCIVITFLNLILVNISMLTVSKQCKISVVKKTSLEQEYWQEPPVTTFPINLSDKCATTSSLMLHAQPVISECGLGSKKGTQKYVCL